MLTVVFFVVYVVFYGIMYYVLGGNITNAISSRVIDIFALVIFAFFVLYYYFGSSESDIEQSFGNGLLSFRNFLDTPSSIFTMIILIVLKYMFMYITNVPMGDHKPYSVILLEGALWGTFALVIFGRVFHYLFGFSIIDMIFNPLIEVWGSIPTNPNTPIPLSKHHHQWDVSGGTPTPSMGPPTTPPPKLEVYNIANNLYTYDEAQAICETYGARLATYDEIEDSYNNGGEWCNYGWSDGQLALFPTQKNTWNQLQLTKTHKNDCGRPGINGGYIDNPYVQFGVNCYGVKPTPGPNDNKASMNFVDSISATTDSSANNLAKNAVLNAFNYKKWSEF
jgi:Extracellular link domain